MVRIIFTGLILVAVSFSPAWAQQTLILGQNNYSNQKGIIYSKEVSTDFRFHTNGAAFGMNFGKIRSVTRTSLFYVGLGEIKHPRETRQNRNFPIGGIGNFRGFIYGKQNNLFALRGGIGEKRYLSEKARRKGVAVGVSYEGGPTLGLLKPYYLVLRFEPADFNLANYRGERYSEDNADRFLSNDKIFGADSFSKGLDEISLLPGLHGKASLHFDWGAFDEFVKAVETGVMIDFFFKSAPLLVEHESLTNNQNRAVFINLFITLQLGKRS